MITQIRKSFNSKAFKIFLWATLIVVSGVFGIFELFKKGGGKDNWIAQVNGEKVWVKDFARQAGYIEEQIRAFKLQFAQYAQFMNNLPDPRVEALDTVIKNALQNEAFATLDVAISPEYIQDKLSDAQFVQQALGDLIPMQTLNPDGSINAKALKAYLASPLIHLTVDEFNERIHDVIARQILLELVLSSWYVPQFEMVEFFKSHFLGRSFSIVTFPLQAIIAKEKSTPITKAEIKEYFDAQNSATQRYYIPEKRSGTVWMFDVDSFGATVADKDIKEYYERNKATKYLLSPAKVQVRRILFKIDSPEQETAVHEQAKKVLELVLQNPASFESLAKQYSQDQASASKGGLLAAFAKGERDKNLEYSAFLLAKDGDVSQIFKSVDGFEIIQRVNKSAQSFKELSSVEAEIKKALTAQKFQNQFNREAKGAITKGKKDAAALTSFVQQKKGLAKQLNQVTVTDSDKAVQELFKLKPQESIAYVDGQKGYVVTLSKVEPRNLPDITVLEQQVTQDIYRERALKTIERNMVEARMQLSQGKQLADIAKTFGATTEKTGTIKADDSQVVQSLEKQGLPVAQLFQLEKIGATTTAIKNDAGVLVILDSVEPYETAKFEQKKDQINSVLTREYLKVYIEAFVASLYRNATIKTNDSVLKALK